MSPGLKLLIKQAQAAGLDQPAQPIKAAGRDKLVAQLNAALTAEFKATQLYTLAAALVTGEARLDLAEYLAGEAADELKHAKLLSDKLVAMGELPKVGAITISIDPVTNQRLLELIFEAEKKAVETYSELVDLGEQHATRAFVVLMENILEDEQQHLETTQKLLDRGQP
jgi:bacterioferritin